MDDRSSCIDELDACFVACEEAYARLRTGGVDVRDSGLGNALLLAAATAVVASESLSAGDGRVPALVAITAEACRDCADACRRDGAHWLAPARDACTAAAAACATLAGRPVGDGET